MSLTIFEKSSILDVWVGSEYAFELFNWILVEHQFFAASSWRNIFTEHFWGGTEVSKYI